MNPRDHVVLVSDDDVEQGVMDKFAAHSGGGHLHRAVSVSVSDGQGRVLLQRRSPEKYHFANLWSNSCCTHPEPGEPAEQTAQRRCAEELGVEVVSLRHHGWFIYRAHDPVSGLTEWELDHVFTASTDESPNPDPTEICDLRWLAWDDARAEATAGADCTPWLGTVLDTAGR